MKIVMSAAHGGFGSENIPLGGGAAIFERLAASATFSKNELQLLGAGPRQPAGAQYFQILKKTTAPSSMGMMEYARFCHQFGAATTEAVLEMKPDLLLCHDISEGPDVARLSKAGIRVATIFHVDVVDIFSRLYLGGVIDPVRLASAYRRMRHLPWPSVLELVFKKQQEVADYGALSVVPSSGARELLERCYPNSRAPVVEIGWGVPEQRYSELQIQQQSQALRQRHGIPEEHRVLLTLSRLSPEKAQHRLLKAIAWAEAEGRMPSNITVVIAGAPAFMEGQRHQRRLLSQAKKLRTRVVFPGHVGGLEKAGWYETATIFVVNSIHESYGLTTLEAMQHRCPVVAVRSFGTADTVTQNVGRLVPAGPELERRLWGTLEYYLRPASRQKLETLGRNAFEEAKLATFERAASALQVALNRLLA